MQVITEEGYKAYFDCLFKGDRSGCASRVKRLLDAGVEIELLYTNLFQRSLYQIGELWEQGKISVATEHLATSITESVLNLAYPVLFAGKRIARSAVISCVANEYHQIGGKMVADVFELCGWDSYFLGANTPSEDLLRLLEEKRPDMLGLSLSTRARIPAVNKILQAVRETHPSMHVIIGGQGIPPDGKGVVEAYPSAQAVPSLEALKDLIRGGEFRDG